MKSRNLLVHLFFIISMAIASAQDSIGYKMMLIDGRLGLTENKVRNIVPMDNGCMAIFTSADLLCFDGARFMNNALVLKHGYPLSNFHNTYRVQAKDANDIYWRKEKQQLRAVNLRTMTEVDSIGRLFHDWGITDSIADFFIDDEGRHWMLSVNGVLFFQTGNNKVQHVEGHVNNDLVAIASIHQRGYVCHTTGTVEEFDCKSGKKLAEMEPINLETADSLKAYAKVVYHKGKLWMLRPYAHQISKKTDANTRVKQSILMCMDISSRQWTMRRLLDGTLYDMAFTKNDQLLIVGDEHLYLIDLHNNETQDLMPVLVTDNFSERRLRDDVCCITIDKEGGWWVGLHSKGLLYYHPTRLNLFSRKDQPLSNTERCPIFSDADIEATARNLAPETTNCTLRDTRGYIFIGTREGLLITDPRNHRQRYITEADGLPGNNIVSLTEDYDGDIWVVTSGSICFLHFKENGHWQLRCFGATEGLILSGSEFQNRFITKRGDSICVGFADGTYSFVPSLLKQTQGYRTDISMIDSSGRQNNLQYKWLIPIGLLAILGMGFLTVRRRRLRNNVQLIPTQESESTFSDRINPTEMNLQRIMAPSAKTDQHPSIDDLFLEKLRTTVLENLHDERLNVNTLSQLLAMDRSVLYRRMQALTATAPSAYILNLRMQTAMQLLQEGGYAVNEVAKLVGFSNTKYFSVVFKKTFGITPIQANSQKTR